MPDLILPGGSGSGGGRPSGGLIRNPSADPQGTNVENAGRVSVTATDIGGSVLTSIGNLNAGFIGVGKGLVSFVENLPIIGGITKPLIQVTGGIMDATIGNVVKAAQGVRIGDTNLGQATVNAIEFVGTPLKWGADALMAGSQYVESEVAKSRIKSTLDGQYSFARSIFGDAPAEAIRSVQNGESIESAAERLAKSGAGFSQDGAHNFLWSFVLDPMNLIAPGIGAAVKVGARASQFAKFVNASNDVAIAAAKAAGRLEEAEKLVEAQKFLNKWGWAGTMYDQTIGRMKGAMGKLAPKYAKEITRVIWRVHSPKVVDDVVETVALFSGKGREVAERGLRNVAITAAGAVRSGIVKAVSSIRRMNSDNLSKSIVSYVEKQVRNGKDAATILGEKLEESTLTLGEIMEKSGISAQKQQQFVKLIADQANLGVRSDELLRLGEVDSFVYELARGHNSWYVKNRAESMRATARWRETLDARLGAEEAQRIFSEAKQQQIPNGRAIQERIAAGNGIEQAAPDLINDLVNGFGMARPEAIKAASTLINKYGNDLDKLADVLSIARSANYGRRVEGLALIRAKIGKIIAEKVGDIPAKYARITLVSVRTLTESDVADLKKSIEALRAAEKAAIEAGDDAAASAARAQMRDLADDIVYRFDDAAANFDPKFPVDEADIAAAKAAGRYTYEDVFTWLEKVEGRVAVSIKKKELLEIRDLAKTYPIFDDLLGYVDDLEAAGYRLGIAPESGVVETSTLRSLDNGAEAWQDVMLPWVDTLDVTDIEKLDTGLQGVKLQPTRMEMILDRFTRKYGSETVRSRVSEKFISSLVGKTGISVRKARSILAKINTKAAELNLKPQSMFWEKNLIEQIFVEEMTPIEFQRLINSGTDPMKEIITAAAGDYRTVGLTSGFTGRVKSVFPAITLLTDRAWGEFKFGRLNPYFNLVMERIETQFQLIANNIWKKVSDQFADEYRGTILLRNMRDRVNVNPEFADGLVYHLRKRTEATMTIAQSASGFSARAGRVIQDVRSKLKTATSIDHVRIVKQGARDMMTDRYATKQIVELLSQTRPDILNELAVHYGVTSAEDITELVLGEMIMMSEPALLGDLIKMNAKKARTLTGESIRQGMADSFVKNRGMTPERAMAEATRLSQEIADAVVGAYEVAIERAARAADTAQYFSNYRSWFERSINHPILALYPYSYMVQKGIPSTMKMLFLTPGPKGIVMPGWGFVKYQQIAEYLQDQMNSNSSFLGQVLNSEPAMLVIGGLIPANPQNIGFGMSGGVRTYFVKPALKGEEINLETIQNVSRGTWDTFYAGTAAGQLSRVIDIGKEAETLNVNQSIQDVIQGSAGNIQELIQTELEGLRNP